MTAFTPAQAAAIDAAEPRLLVSAGPGSGKTRVLIGRIIRLIRDGTPSNRIACITYTVSAAAELAERLAKSEPLICHCGEYCDTHVSSDHSPVPMEDEPLRIGFTGTLHGWLLRLLTQHGSLIGLRPPMAVIDEEEQAALLTDALEETAYRGSLKAVEAEVAKGPQARLNPMTAPQIAAEAFFQRLRADGILTFDMILHAGERLLAAMKAKGVEVGVDHLLVDEAADLTEQDGRIITISGIPNIWICGDFDQSIFGWRSGDKTNWFENCCKMATPALACKKPTALSLGCLVALQKRIHQQRLAL